MDIRELKSRFNQCRDFSTEDVNALMDFVKRAYIYNEISIIEYRNLVRELEKLGAVIPEAPEHSLIEMHE
jgi:Lhr-like helicase